MSKLEKFYEELPLTPRQKKTCESAAFWMVTVGLGLIYGICIALAHIL